MTKQDAETNEILAYEVSSFLHLENALNTLKKLKKHTHLAKEAFIHSNQGFHYTNPVYQVLVKKMNLDRGNCWDNAPQESFSGHFKDETLEDVKREIKS